MVVITDNPRRKYLDPRLEPPPAPMAQATEGDLALARDLAQGVTPYAVSDGSVRKVAQALASARAQDRARIEALERQVREDGLLIKDCERPITELIGRNPTRQPRLRHARSSGNPRGHPQQDHPPMTDTAVVRELGRQLYQYAATEHGKRSQLHREIVRLVFDDPLKLADAIEALQDSPDE